MKKLIFALLLFPASLLVVFQPTAQPAQAEHQKNYNNCLHGYAGCDPSQLTDAERSQVQQAAHQRNYNNCLHGYSGCNPAELTASESKTISAGGRNSAEDSSTPSQGTTPSQNTTPSQD